MIFFFLPAAKPFVLEQSTISLALSRHESSFLKWKWWWNTIQYYLLIVSLCTLPSL